MDFKKVLTVAAVGAVTVGTAVPAMALENEFHGMFKAMFYQSNFFNGRSNNLFDDANDGLFAEQRARIQYIAKANNDLKLVTMFELDSRFGGKFERYLGTQDGNDAGNLDADQLTLETKNIYLDFKDPFAEANWKVGLQGWADSYNSIFLLADMTGVNASKKFGPATASLGWFRFDDDTANNANAVGDLTADLFTADVKYAVNPDTTVGLSYYFVNNDNNAAVQVGPPTAISSAAASVNTIAELNVIGVNASVKAGPATINPFFAYEFGNVNAAQADDGNDNVSAFLAGATAKVKVGPGNINFATLYLSGDNGDDTDAREGSFRIIAPGTSYFNAANMWLLIRSGQAINSSSSVLGNDLTVRGRGLFGVFAGYEGTAGKVFYSANAGYAQTAKDRDDESKELGTEINATIGYKLFDNLSASLTGAYVFLGKGLGGEAGNGRIAGFGAADDNARDPYLANVQLSYTF